MARGEQRGLVRENSCFASAICFPWSYALTFRQISTSTVQIPNHNVAIAQSASHEFCCSLVRSVPALTGMFRRFPQRANAASESDQSKGLFLKVPPNPTGACLSWLASSTSVAACLRSASGVGETFQRFLLTLTPMFSPHIKLFGGLPLSFLPRPPRGKMRSWRKMLKKYLAVGHLFFSLYSVKTCAIALWPTSLANLLDFFIVRVRVFTHRTGDVRTGVETLRLWKLAPTVFPR